MLLVTYANNPSADITTPKGPAPVDTVGDTSKVNNPVLVSLVNSDMLAPALLVAYIFFPSDDIVSPNKLLEPDTVPVTDAGLSAVRFPVLVFLLS